MVSGSTSQLPLKILLLHDAGSRSKRTAHDGTSLRLLTAVVVGYAADITDACAEGLMMGLMDATPPTGSHSF